MLFTMFKDFVEILRIRQWGKNLFIISPLIFSGHFYNFVLWQQCILTTIGFCLISSGMNIFNDIFDIQEDRAHPQKSQRPLAAGTISLLTAQVLVIICLLTGLFLCILQGKNVFILASSFILSHFLYNIWTKHIAIVDVLTGALGFQIRIWAGAVAGHIIPSVWLQICMFVLALFLGFTKRRCDFTYLKQPQALYTEHFLDQMIIICSTLSIVLYGLYAVSPEVTSRLHGYTMFYSIAFVVYSIFRYLFLLYIKKLDSDPSEVLLLDTSMVVNIVLWVFSIILIIQLSHA